MANLSDIRGGIATVLQGISGLRTATDTPGQIAPPIAVIGWPERIDYDQTMGRGTDEYVIPVRLFVSSASARAADDLLEGYLNKSGATSVKATFDATRPQTLGGVVSDARVRSMTGAGVVEHGAGQYLAADFEIVVLA